MKDKEYLISVSSTLEHLLERFNPDLILYDAGLDVYEHDSLGLLDISLTGIQTRDEQILQLCKEKNVPVATVSEAAAKIYCT